MKNLSAKAFLTIGWNLELYSVYSGAGPQHNWYFPGRQKDCNLLLHLTRTTKYFFENFKGGNCPVAPLAADCPGGFVVFIYWIKDVFATSAWLNAILSCNEITSQIHKIGDVLWRRSMAVRKQQHAACRRLSWVNSKKMTGMIFWQAKLRI